MTYLESAAAVAAITVLVALIFAIGLPTLLNEPTTLRLRWTVFKLVTRICVLFYAVVAALAVAAYLVTTILQL